MNEQTVFKKKDLTFKPRATVVDATEKEPFSLNEDKAQTKSKGASRGVILSSEKKEVVDFRNVQERDELFSEYLSATNEDQSAKAFYVDLAPQELHLTPDLEVEDVNQEDVLQNLTDIEEEREWEEAQFKKGMSKASSSLPMAFFATPIVIRDVEYYKSQFIEEIDNIKHSLQHANESLKELAMDVCEYDETDYDLIMQLLKSFLEWADDSPFKCPFDLTDVFNALKTLNMATDQVLFAIIERVMRAELASFADCSHFDSFCDKNGVSDLLRPVLVESLLPELIEASLKPMETLESYKQYIKPEQYESFTGLMREMR